MKRPSSSSRKRFGAFDFGKEDEKIESASSKFLFKFSPITKYTFLQRFAPCTKTMPKKKMNNEPIEIDDSSADRQSRNSGTRVLEVSEEDSGDLSDHEPKSNHLSEVNSYPDKRLNLGQSSATINILETTPSNNEPIGVMSDDENSRSSFPCNLDDDEETTHEFSFDGFVIYPEGDPDAVCISKSDIERLQPETFLNDTLIDFYIKYLQNKLRPEDKHRFHFFNCFFFRKLADLDKDPSNACDGRAAFQRVHKWTRKVNLFDKDYIFIPVNFSLHWSLIVICHLGEVSNFEDEEIEKSARVPCILHLDSKIGSHKGLKELIQRYLLEEWSERESEPHEDNVSRFLDLRFLQLELPQQENSFDCGLFLLHYVELFLEHAPLDFNPVHVTTKFLTKGWFPPADASVKRRNIKKLIFDIFKNTAVKIPLADCNDNSPCEVVVDTAKRESMIERFEEMCNQTKIGNDIPSTDEYDKQVTESPAVATSPQIGKSELLSIDLFEREAMAGLLTNKAPRKSTLSPIKETEVIEEHIIYKPSSKSYCHEDHVTVVESPASAHFTQNSKINQTSKNPEISMHLEEHDQSGGSSTGECFFSLDETVGEKDEHQSALVSCEDFAEVVVEDSEEVDETHDDAHVSEEDSVDSFQAQMIDLWSEETNSCESIDLKLKNTPLIKGKAHLEVRKTKSRVERKKPIVQQVIIDLS